MKRYLLFPILAALAVVCASCSGCQIAQDVASNRPVLGQTVLDEKALIFAEQAFGLVQDEASAAVRTGLVVQGSPTAVQIADGLVVAHNVLKAARAAYAAGDAATFTDKLHAVQDAVAAVMAILPRARPG